MHYYGTRLSENISRREPEGYLLCLNVPVARTGTQDLVRECCVPEVWITYLERTGKLFPHTPSRFFVGLSNVLGIPRMCLLHMASISGDGLKSDERKPDCPFRDGWTCIMDLFYDFSEAYPERQVTFSVVAKIYFEILDKSPEEKDRIKGEWAKKIEATCPYREERNPAEEKLC